MKIRVVASEAMPATKKIRLSIAAGQRPGCLAPVLRIRTPARIEAKLAPNNVAVWNRVMRRLCTRSRGGANVGWLAGFLVLHSGGTQSASPRARVLACFAQVDSDPNDDEWFVPTTR